MTELPFQVDLKDKVVVVTGGAGVLGAAMCRALAACGAKIVVLGRDLAKAEALAHEIEHAGGRAMGISANVLDQPSLELAADHIKATFGPCDILINGAGGNNPKGVTGQRYFDPLTAGPDNTSFLELDIAGFQSVFDLNFMGSLLPSQVFGKHMVSREGCSIINIASMASYRPLTQVAAYSSAKAAIANFTQWLATHFARHGIRVNALAPGFFITEQNRKMMVNEDGSYTERAQRVIAQTPMARFGTADELLGALLWLASSKASSFVTGSIIPVDGGYSSYSGV
ncbi:MAG: SDR family oxidoreductase [Rhodocyclaceae bacterium]